jgi:hypothetical protein
MVRSQGKGGEDRGGHFNYSDAARVRSVLSRESLATGGRSHFPLRADGSMSRSIRRSPHSRFLLPEPGAQRSPFLTAEPCYRANREA